jgi:RHS repeat-associated protein
LSTDGNGRVAGAFEYLPYGEVLSQGSAGDEAILETAGFNGKERDAETGLIYYGARYAMPSFARWMSADPLAMSRPDAINTSREATNLFGFAGGNPVSRFDAVGTQSTVVTDERPPSTASLAGAAAGVAIAESEIGVALASTRLLVGATLGAVAVAAAEHGRREEEKKQHVTYTLVNPITGQIYVGRTQGDARESPQRIVENRFLGHHMKEKGFGNPVVDQAAAGPLAYMAIRGREQQMIDFFGGVGDPKVGNAIRGVSQRNPFGYEYHQAASQLFGEMHPFTGNLRWDFLPNMR